MKKTLAVWVMAVLVSMGFVGCGDSDKGKGTGAKTFEGAVQKLCEDYVVGCRDASGREMTLEDCQVARNEELESGESAECYLASVDFSYCVMREYPGDHCQIYDSDGMDDMNDIGGLSPSEQLDILQTCMKLFEKMQNNCMNVDDSDPFGDHDGTDTPGAMSVQSFCQDFIIGCAREDGITITPEACEADLAVSGGAACQQAIVDFAYCSSNALGGDHCLYSDMDINSLTESEQAAVAMACSDQLQAYVIECQAQ